MHRDVGDGDAHAWHVGGERGHPLLEVGEGELEDLLVLRAHDHHRRGIVEDVAALVGHRAALLRRFVDVEAPTVGGHHRPAGHDDVVLRLAIRLGDLPGDAHAIGVAGREDARRGGGERECGTSDRERDPGATSEHHGDVLRGQRCSRATRDRR